MTISKDDFAHKMTSALRDAGVVGELRYDPERFALVGASAIFLDGAHREYLAAAPSRRGHVLESHATRLARLPAQTLPATFAEARGQLVPIVRSAGYVDAAQLLRDLSSASSGSGALTFDAYADGLCVGLAYDTPDAFVMFSTSQLDAWKITFADALQAARQRLAARSQEPLAPRSPGLFAGCWQDGNAAGRLLVPELFAGVAVVGDVVAMAPEPDLLLVAGSRDARALGAMVTAAEQAAQRPKPNSPDLYRLDGERWLPFALPERHPLAARHAELRNRFRAVAYDEQKKLLEQIYARDGVDRFVAGYNLAQRPDGGVFSWCAWDDCAALLPRTDLLVIADVTARTPEAARILVSWSTARDVVGHRLTLERWHLERYRVDGAPNATELAALARRAVRP